MKEEKKYYNFQEIMKFLNFYYFLKEDYPFNQGLENIEFGWGNLIIPRDGIEKTIQNKIGDINDGSSLKEIKMLYQIPFVCKGKTGIINKDIVLTFRYDKEFKYGNINKNVYECCYFIDKYATKTNNFYIVDNEMIFEFMSYFVIDNQWWLGREVVSSLPMEKVEFLKEGTNEK
jgi:hypothetical protein